jgi:hypothetical protein
MTDHTTLIAELREHAEWARSELRQSQAELFDRAADALELETAQPELTPKQRKRIEAIIRERGLRSL